MKRGRPASSKDKSPRKKRETKDHKENADKMDIEINDSKLPEGVQDTEIEEENKKISINYVSNGIKWDRKEITVDNIFAYNVPVDLLKEDKDYEAKSIEECRKEMIGQNGKMKYRQS